MITRKEIIVALSCALVAAMVGTTPGWAKDQGFKLMMTPKWIGFPYFEAAGKGAKAAADELGDTLVYAGADHADVTLQAETLQNFITQRPDAIMLSSIDVDSSAPVLRQARKRGIVVTTWDADTATNARDMFVNPISGEGGAKLLLDAALMDAPEGGEIAFISASPISQNHMQWIRAMQQMIKTDPKYKVFKEVGEIQYADDDDAKSYNVATNLMQAHLDLKIIMSPSAVTGPAAARAVLAANRVGKTFAVSFALPSAIKSYLKDGSAKAFALWNPFLLGYVTTYATHLKLAGKLDVKPGATFTAGKAGTWTIGENGVIDFNRPIVFTKDNIDEQSF
jgi:rhamnose transport system substrate-binding protein